MKIVFVGSVEGSQRALSAICTRGHVPSLIVTLPPEKSARHSDYADLRPMAEAHGVPVHTTLKSDSDETCAAVAAADPDVTLVIGWSQICGPRFRGLARHGTIGFHPAPLPRLRGRGVIPWAILRGETEGGATLFWLDDGVDSGPIAAQRRFEIDPETVTARALYDKATGALAEMLPDLLDQLQSGARPSRVQEEAEASLCARRRPEDGWIDWSAPAIQIDRLIRAVGPPYPGALTRLPGGEPLTILAARRSAREGYYIGMPGQVQAVTGRNFTVYCGDDCCLEVTDWAGAASPPALHSQLGGRLSPC